MEKALRHKLTCALLCGSIAVLLAVGILPTEAATRTDRHAALEARITALRAFFSTLGVGKRYDIGNLSIYTVETTEPDWEHFYVTVDEALTNKTLVLAEDPASTNYERGRGDTILLQYSGRDRVYYQRATSSDGGRQGRGTSTDRTFSGTASSTSGGTGLGGFGFQLLQEETPAATPYARARKSRRYAESGGITGGRIDVYCFEKERSTGDSDYFRSANLAGPRLRYALIKRANQRRIWRLIRKELGRLEAHDPNEAFEAVYATPHVQDAVHFYVSNAADMPLRTKETVGIVVCSGDDVIGADIYTSPQLFEKMLPKLMASYSLEALDPPRSPRTLTPEYVGRFLGQAGRARKWRTRSRDPHSLYLTGGNVVGAVSFFEDDVVHVELYPSPPAWLAR